MTPSDFDSIKDWLEKINLSIEPSDLESLVKAMKITKFKKGEMITKQGEVEKKMYFIKTGVARAFFVHNKEEYCFRFFFDNEFVSAYFSLITQTPSEDSIQALTDTDAFYIDYETITHLIKTNERVKLLQQKSIEYFYHEKMEAQKQLLCLTAEERYQKLIQNNTKLIQEIPLKHLSSYLGIKPQSLSRIRKTMK